MIRRPARGEPGLDVLRGVLVIGMFAVHARRLQPGGTQVGTLGDRALDFLMWSEPFIAAGFLFVVGTSLAIVVCGIATVVPLGRGLRAFRKLEFS